MYMYMPGGYGTYGYEEYEPTWSDHYWNHRRSEKTKLNTALIEDTKLASLKKIFSDNPPIDPSWSKTLLYYRHSSHRQYDNSIEAISRSVKKDIRKAIQALKKGPKNQAALFDNIKTKYQGFSLFFHLQASEQDIIKLNSAFFAAKNTIHAIKTDKSNGDSGGGNNASFSNPRQALIPLPEILLSDSDSTDDSEPCAYPRDNPRQFFELNKEQHSLILLLREIQKHDYDLDLTLATSIKSYLDAHPGDAKILFFFSDKSPLHRAIMNPESFNLLLELATQANILHPLISHQLATHEGLDETLLARTIRCGQAEQAHRLIDITGNFSNKDRTTALLNSRSEPHMASAFTQAIVTDKHSLFSKICDILADMSTNEGRSPLHLALNTYTTITLPDDWSDFEAYTYKEICKRKELLALFRPKHFTAAGTTTSYSASALRAMAECQYEQSYGDENERYFLEINRYIDSYDDGADQDYLNLASYRLADMRNKANTFFNARGLNYSPECLRSISRCEIKLSFLLQMTNPSPITLPSSDMASSINLDCPKSAEYLFKTTEPLIVSKSDISKAFNTFLPSAPFDDCKKIALILLANYAGNPAKINDIQSALVSFLNDAKKRSVLTIKIMDNATCFLCLCKIKQASSSLARKLSEIKQLYTLPDGSSYKDKECYVLCDHSLNYLYAKGFSQLTKCFLTIRLNAHLIKNNWSGDWSHCRQMAELSIVFSSLRKALANCLLPIINQVVNEFRKNNALKATAVQLNETDFPGNVMMIPRRVNCSGGGAEKNTGATPK